MDKNRLVVSVAGKELIFETGKIARQASGAVTVKSGDTLVFASACGKKDKPDDIDFLPLRVDYQEKFSSAGKSLGGFIKREGRPTERETLVCRLIDRPIRPLFEDGYFNDVQVISYVFSYDNEHPPEPLAICAVSAALTLSDIPFKKPIAGVRMGMIDDKFIINPTIEEQKQSKLDLMLAGTSDAILMIEGYCDFLTEEQVLEAINEGHEAIKTICDALSDWQKIAGKEKFTASLITPPKKLIDDIQKLVGGDLNKALRIADKLEREAAQNEINARIDEAFKGEESEYSNAQVSIARKKVTSGILRDMIFNENTRADGRKCDEIRPISIEPSLLPRAHGSVLFTRGETQTIAVCTLGPEDMGQRYETLEGDGLRQFYLQYFFPPFSVGEVGRMGPAARREVGHGKLAERALESSIPAQENFPYTIRLESNITESNGSSSMASVCGGCLAMMNAGVPIKRPVAGIAMGLVMGENNFAVLSDILGVEDFLGDMDFKITGDESGITAFQLDIKVEGITPKIMQVALQQAKQGRIHILKKMLEVVPSANESLSQYAPRIESVQIHPSKIGMLIGPGGKQIRAIIEESGAEVNINDDGVVQVSSTNGEAMQKALEMINDVVADVEVGKTYKGTVVSIVAFGMFVKIFSKEGLVHISELDHKRVDEVSDLFKEGDEVEVKVIEVNDRGQIRLSRKALLPKPEGMSDDDGEGGERRQKRERREKRDKPPRQKPSGEQKTHSILPPPPVIQR
ncbi:MAG: polyribonucleotide nucleotidyltransferase [Simkaniaceae bacterium]|nr:polyribonucleotide nucleotidyltransferase [Simkaniaceae bacterium]